MAKLDVQSFTPGPGTLPGIAADMDFLLNAVKRALKELTGSQMTADGRFINPPRNLDPRRFAIRKDYADIWNKTSIVFDFNTYGATATHSTNTIRIGEFFLSTLRKYEHIRNVVAHEFLHLVITLPRPLHHGEINNIIKQGMKLSDEANPYGTD